MRVGEERGLLWKDIDFENGILTVKRTYDFRYGFSPCPKDRAERIIPLSPELYEVLLARKNEISPKPDDFVLPMLRKWRQREQCDPLRALCERFDYPVIRWHDLRASFAVMLFMQGVPALQIQDLLGHESLETTENYLRKLGVYLKGSTNGLSFFGPKDPSSLAYDRNKSSYFIEQQSSISLDSGGKEEIPIDLRLILNKEALSN
ncbi:MAG: site-specific integrase [SAR324 cluster bacterium]|uniref:Site-specific integrase n=1 Tax=SAR324 cluster bacterium TaxID=2024889 RepID=A0A7X9FNV3_9DELT|nr:site-specific integrase [SAR324 cluster bacterium]